MEILLATLLIPLAGSLALLFINKKNVNAFKYISFGISLLAFLVSLGLLFSFDKNL